VRLTLVVVLLLCLPLVSLTSSADGRACEIEVSLDHRIWFSDDVIEINVTISGVQYGVLHDIVIQINDASGTQITLNETWQQTATYTSKTFQFQSFFSGERFVSADVSLLKDGSIVGQGNGVFVVLHNSILPSASNILVFGDSLSDMGNAKDSIIDAPDVPPYWNGRFSNGPVWVEYFSDAMGINTTRGSGAQVGDNRAFGGSQTGQGYSYLVLPNVGFQINSYLTNVQSNIASDDLVVLWAGGNDFLYGSANPETISANMASHITALSEAGATRFIVPNLPPLETTPEVQSRTNSQQAQIAADVIEYNQRLATAVADLVSSRNIEVQLLDTYSLFDQIVGNADHLGIINTIDPACSSTGSILPLPICNSGDPVVSNVEQYLYFDKAHPTATMHAAIGNFAESLIGLPDRDGDLIADSNDLCEWTIDEVVDQDGCSWGQRDLDNDGVANAIDLCDDTSLDEIADENGCAPSQRDNDGDGLNDGVDPCPEDPSGSDHDADGCIDLTDDDDDNDGLLDFEDECPKGVIGGFELDTDGDGCVDTEDVDDDNDGLSDEDEATAGSDPLDADSDDDGYQDGADDFPTDASEWRDSDGDGVGDNADVFPNDSEEWDDSDYDGVGDNSDAFPDNPGEWNDRDSDQTGDNSDACPDVFGTSLQPLPGCPDGDGDGWSDDTDAFPEDDSEWNDSDDDGVGDNTDLFPEDTDEWSDKDGDGVGDNSDAFPNDVNEWNDTDSDGHGDNADVFPEDLREWEDFDGDGVGDNGDDFPTDAEYSSDRDGDGYADQVDAFPDDPQAVKDSDNDGVADFYDLFPEDAGDYKDSDGDGVGDSVDPMPFSDRYSSSTDLVVDGSMAIIALLVLVLILRRLT
jgi:phospholipase/lecithinase/hemolysin